MTSKPITTQFAKTDRAVETGGASKGATATGETRDQSKDQMVKVIALRTFHKEENMQGDMVRPGDPPFEVSRSRAAELRANGLIEYVNAADDKAIHGEDGSKRLAARQELDTAARNTVEPHQTTPLRNPELKLADVPEDSDKSKK